MLPVIETLNPRGKTSTLGVGMLYPKLHLGKINKTNKLQ